MEGSDREFGYLKVWQLIIISAGLLDQYWKLNTEKKLGKEDIEKIICLVLILPERSEGFPMVICLIWKHELKLHKQGSALIGYLKQLNTFLIIKFSWVWQNLGLYFLYLSSGHFCLAYRICNSTSKNIWILREYFYY